MSNTSRTIHNPNNSKARSIKPIRNHNLKMKECLRSAEMESRLPYVIKLEYSLKECVDYYNRYNSLPKNVIDDELEEWIRYKKPDTALTDRDRKIIERMKND